MTSSLSLTSPFLQESQDRGFIFQASALQELDTRMAQGPVIAYLGFDATAPSLHVGSLLQIMWLRLLQRNGHKPIVVMGDGTTRVGDPSGKDTQRSLLSAQTIETNIQGIEKIFSKYLTFGDGQTDALIIRNSLWLEDINYLDFLSDYGRHFSVNRMLSFESVKLRLEREQPLSFIEFNYMILQAYDFLELHRRFGCTLQLGGSDQWGNILNGVDLIRRVENQEVFALTSPLITTADGKKMGKTAEGALWLNGDQLSPYHYWQFWRNVADADVGRFLRIYTDLPLTEIQELELFQGADINQAKIVLADEATRLCHGQEALDQIHTTKGSLFEKGQQSWESLKETLPKYMITEAQLAQGYPALEALVATGLVSSKGEARRLIRSQGCRVNDQPLNDEAAVFSVHDFNEEGLLTLTVGKKRHGLLILQKG